MHQQANLKMKLSIILIATVLLLVSSSPLYKIAPGGYKIHPDCLHAIDAEYYEIIEDKSSILTVLLNNGTKLKYPPCPHKILKHGAAWKAWTEYQDASLITNLVSKWKVPVDPQVNSNQILYYWDGVEPTDNQAVLQPVLQWGETPAGGGQYWAMASWFVSATHGAFFSNLILVDNDNTIIGTLTILKNGTWVVTGEVVETKKRTQFGYKPYSTDYSYVYEVLEAYYVDTECDLYPITGSLEFYEIRVEAGGKSVTPIWKPRTQTANCGEKFSVESPDHVTLHWNTQ